MRYWVGRRRLPEVYINVRNLLDRTPGDVVNLVLNHSALNDRNRGKLPSQRSTRHSRTCTYLSKVAARTSVERRNVRGEKEDVTPERGEQSAETEVCQKGLHDGGGM